MAKRKGSNKKRRSSRSSRVGSSGIGRSIDGLIAGAGGVLLGKFMPIGAYTQPVADGITGYFRHNETLQTIAGRSLGAMFASGINLPTSTVSGSTSTGLVG